MSASPANVIPYRPGSIARGGELLDSVMAHAVARPDLEALAVLEGIDPHAAGADERIGRDLETLMFALRSTMPEALATVMPELRRRYAGGNPEALRGAVEALNECTRAYFATPEAPPALPRETDFTGAFDLADQPVPMVFDEAMPRGELSVVASEPGTGKTALVLGLALSVVLGRGFVANFTPQARGRALLLLAEDGPVPIAQRLRAWCELIGASRDEYEQACQAGRLTIICADSARLLDFGPGGQATPTAAYRELIKRCEAERYDLIAVDSFLEWTAVGSENDNAVMHAAGKCLIDVARASDGAVVALCHTNKASDKTGEIGLHSIRGGSALAAKIRWGAVLASLTDGEVKHFGIDQADRWRYLKLATVKSQYTVHRGRPQFLERATGGALESIKLTPPSEGDQLLMLAEDFAHAVGENRADLSARDLTRGEHGTLWRAALKKRNPMATRDRLTEAYDLALEHGFIEEETTMVAGTEKRIPRRRKTVS